MVYQDKFVVTVLVNGQVMPEQGNVVAIPFGSEYSLRFRNKNNRRAVVKFTIDGEEASDGGYIIAAYGQRGDVIDIKRFAAKDVAFRFAAVDSPAATDFGKNGPDDGTKGLIEAKFYLEKIAVPKTVVPLKRRIGAGGTIPHSTCCTPPRFPLLPEGPQLDYAVETELQTGVTVEGNATGQQFTIESIDIEPNYQTIVVVLRGYNPDRTNPINTLPSPLQTTTHCTHCGAKRLRVSDHFCGQCGTRLN